MTFHSFAFKSNDVLTDVVLADFEDNNLIIVTEYQKVGQIYLVVKDSFHTLQGQDDLYSIRCLLGDEDPKSVGAVRFLAERLKIPKNTIFCVTLRDFSVPHLRLIGNILEKHKTW